MRTRECLECAAKFAPTTNNQVCCCPEHQRARDKRLNAKRRKRRQLTVANGRASRADPIRATVPVCFDVLSQAIRKPANTSAVRWRIELRRREMASQYGAKNMAFLPHPDRL